MVERKPEVIKPVRKYWDSLSQEEQRQYLSSPFPITTLARDAVAFECLQIMDSLGKQSLLSGQISNDRERQRLIETAEQLKDIDWVLSMRIGERIRYG